MDLRIQFLVLLAFCAYANYGQPVNDPEKVEVATENTSQKTDCLSGNIPEKFLEGFIQAMSADMLQPNGEVPADMVDVLVKIYGDQFPKNLIQYGTSEIEITDTEEKPKPQEQDKQQITNHIENQNSISNNTITIDRS